jgi:hypothetical protein
MSGISAINPTRWRVVRADERPNLDPERAERLEPPRRAQPMINIIDLVGNDQSCHGFASISGVLVADLRERGGTS